MLRNFSWYLIVSPYSCPKEAVDTRGRSPEWRREPSEQRVIFPRDRQKWLRPGCHLLVGISWVFFLPLSEWIILYGSLLESNRLITIWNSLVSRELSSSRNTASNMKPTRIKTHAYSVDFVSLVVLSTWTKSGPKILPSILYMRVLLDASEK